METLHLDETSKPEITVAVPTVWEEIQRVKEYSREHKLIEAKEFVLPQGIDASETSQHEVAEIVSQEYDPSFYQAGFEQMQESISTIQQAVDVLRQFEEAWGFKVADSYKILLTRYGSVGSYNDRSNVVYTGVTSEGVVLRNNPARTPIHEMTHLFLEQLVEQYNLSHEEKERLVNGVCTTLFPEIFDPKSKISAEDRLAHLTMLRDLPGVIERVIAER